MAMWRCPHCGTPQAETARCWVCRRSSTSCGTCRHFRASVAAKVGYCGLDRQRQPISGDEIRSCWESRPEPAEPSGDPGVPADPFERPFHVATSSRSPNRHDGRPPDVDGPRTTQPADGPSRSSSPPVVDAALEPLGGPRGLGPARRRLGPTGPLRGRRVARRRGRRRFGGRGRASAPGSGSASGPVSGSASGWASGSGSASATARGPSRGRSRSASPWPRRCPPAGGSARRRSRRARAGRTPRVRMPDRRPASAIAWTACCR